MHHRMYHLVPNHGFWHEQAVCTMRSRTSWDHWYANRRWIARAHHQLREHPLCAYCLQSEKLIPATIADHIVPHRGDWNKFILGDLQSLCKRCHDGGKQVEERKGYRRDIGTDGWPLDPRHPVYRKSSV